MYVRIKPYNARKGHTLRSYTFGGMTFREEVGWYEVAEHVAQKLAGVHMNPESEDTPLAFDVAESIKQAKDIEARYIASLNPQRQDADSLQARRMEDPMNPRDLNEPARTARLAGSRGDVTTGEVKDAMAVERTPAQRERIEREEAEVESEGDGSQRPVGRLTDEPPAARIPGAPPKGKGKGKGGA
jgi:hypothetical protein